MESNPLPLVTIGIPTFNGSTRLPRPIQSIWTQNYPNLEIIISDNCSTDNTKEVVENIRKEHPEIRYIRQDRNISQIPNYYFLLRAAKGKYFIWLADDDFLEPGFLLKAVQFMEEHDNYSLASGRIQYWLGDRPDVVEHGFTFEQNSPGSRVAHFYSKVIYGGLLHGLIRRACTENVTFNYVIGMDYHFVANLVYLGKVKNFDFTGYNKHFGGVSKNFKQYAKFMGESWIVGYFPHLKIAKDAFTEVFSRSSIFSNRPFFSRLALAVTCSLGVLFCYYGRIFIGARVKNHVITPITWALKKTDVKS
ncbi:MAG TPA: glycosyltransferase family A protein [Chryseolinea sp.]|nr:glycosyltransferase family A protein [Chryseolinea sp.]